MEADCIVSVGGGASIGLGKGIALEYARPIVAIPTTYAGSEMTGFCGITIDGVKRMHTSLDMLASTVIYDPELSIGLPLDVSMASAMNALAHCVDAVYLDTVSPIILAAAHEGAAVSMDAMPRVAECPSNRRSSHRPALRWLPRRGGPDRRLRPPARSRAYARRLLRRRAWPIARAGAAACRRLQLRHAPNELGRLAEAMGVIAVGRSDLRSSRSLSGCRRAWRQSASARATSTRGTHYGRDRQRAEPRPGDARGRARAPAGRFRRTTAGMIERLVNLVWILLPALAPPRSPGSIGLIWALRT